MRPLGTYEPLPLDVTLPVNVERRELNGPDLFGVLWWIVSDGRDTARHHELRIALDRLGALQAWPPFETESPDFVSKEALELKARGYRRTARAVRQPALTD